MLQPFVPFLRGIFPSCVDPCFLTVLRQQLGFWHPSFLLIQFSLSDLFIIVILCCCFISSSSVNSSCLLWKRCKLYSLNKAKILAQQSSPYFLILYLLFLRTLLHSKGSPLPLKALFRSLRLFTFPGLPPPFFQPTSSSTDPSRFGSDFSIFSSLPYLPPQQHLALVAFVHLPPVQVLFCMASNFKQFPSIPFFFFQPFLPNVAPLPIVLPFGSPSCQLSSSSSLSSNCEQSHLCVGFRPSVHFLSFLPQSSKAII